MTDNDDLRDRVAKAICEANCKEWRTGTYRAGGFHDADPLNNHWRHMADAALAATPIKALQQRVERLERALRLAANRLVRCAVEMDTDSREFVEWKDWADEARAALGDDVG